MAVRSDVGTALVRSWARKCLPPSAAVLDIGCGSGVPIARALVSDGFTVWGIDASPSLVAAYRRNLPGMTAACEPAQDSSFFDRSFIGVISIGLVFLLDAPDQRKLLVNVVESAGTWRELPVQRAGGNMHVARHADRSHVDVARCEGLRRPSR